MYNVCFIFLVETDMKLGVTYLEIGAQNKERVEIKNFCTLTWLRSQNSRNMSVSICVCLGHTS